MLSLRIVRGPLTDRENEFVLREYNRLTASRIPMNMYLRWVQGSPDGPAFHALLDTDQGEIAGHFCLIPVRAEGAGRKLTAAKAEYLFVREGFRSAPVRGFEDAPKPPAILLLEQLYRRCSQEGWGPFLASARQELHPLHRLAGCRPADFAVRECLFILKPWKAATQTPNLSAKQRVGVFLWGLAQRGVWPLAAAFRSGANGARTIPLHSREIKPGEERLGLFRDKRAVQWRYPEQDYMRLALDDHPDDFLIAKRGSQERFLRVCQWGLKPDSGIKSLAFALIEEAKAEGGCGVRWAVYAGSDASERIVRELRGMGFVCPPRMRWLLLYTTDRALLEPDLWRISDAFFNFDE